MAQPKDRNEIQIKTFTRWVNNTLVDAMTRVDTLAEGFVDGTKLVILMELLSSSKIGKFETNPTKKMQMIENINKALTFIEKVEKIKLVNIGAPDIHAGNVTLLLGLVWTLILHYDIHGHRNKGGEAKKGSAKSLLLEWCNYICPDRKFTNFTSDWMDGMGLTELINELRPGTIPKPHSTDPETCASRAIKAATELMGIPELIDGKDFVSKDCDDLSRMTFIAQFQKYYEAHKDEIDARKKSGMNAEAYMAQEGNRLAEEEARRKAEEDAKKRAEEEERRRKAAEEDARRKAELDAEAERLRQAEEEARRRREEAEALAAANAAAELRRLEALAAELKRQEEELERRNRALAEQEDRLRREEEEDRLRREEEAAAALRQREDEERRRQEEEERRRREEEARRREEEARQREEEERRRLEEEERRLREEEEAAERERLRKIKEAEDAEQARQAEVARRRANAPKKSISLQHGVLSVSGMKPMSLEGASIARAIDPQDGSMRVVVTSKPDASGKRERLVLEPSKEEFAPTISHLERQIQTANALAQTWGDRHHEVVPGFLRVFVEPTGEGSRRMEREIRLTDVSIARLSLPNKPHLIKITSNIDNEVMLIDAKSADQLEQWLETIEQEQQKASY
eukprot:m.380603 g.380603  ORF g.380603 m.380603 type:complete len:632 (+) comp56235_c0_seq2:352-2247(+)